MRAFRLLEVQQPAKLVDVSKPKAGSGQVLIKVGGCDLCHTDLAIMRKTKAELGARHANSPPFTLGHEIAGWIDEIGSGVDAFKTGEPVAVVPLWGSCGRCPPCRRGEENFCYNNAGEFGAGIGFDGGMAEYIAVPAQFVVHMGDLDSVLGAPLTDAGLTTYTAIKPALPSLVPGSSAVVIGIGALGLLAVQFLRNLCAARVIAVDNDPTHLQLAKKHGADNTLPSDATTADQVRDLSKARGQTSFSTALALKPLSKQVWVRLQIWEGSAWSVLRTARYLLGCILCRGAASSRPASTVAQPTFLRSWNSRDSGASGPSWNDMRLSALLTPTVILRLES
jgi:propanol-preferring alcohol dehydrogenase